MKTLLKRATRYTEIDITFNDPEPMGLRLRLNAFTLFGVFTFYDEFFKIFFTGITILGVSISISVGKVYRVDEEEIII